MPILGVISLLVQFGFAYHVLKSGRPYWWIFIIMAFPVLGCSLYYFIEVFPTSREVRRANRAVRTISRAIAPDKELRARVGDLEICGSVDNKLALARECMECGQPAEAARMYRSAMQGLHANDAQMRFELMQALLVEGAPATFTEAAQHARTLLQTHPRFRTEDVRLALAKALEGEGDLAGALAELEPLAEIFPGEEARWRYGALLIRLGRADEAAQVFSAMLRRAERMPRHYRQAQREWLGLARQNARV